MGAEFDNHIKRIDLINDLRNMIRANDKTFDCVEEFDLNCEHELCPFFVFVKKDDNVIFVGCAARVIMNPGNKELRKPVEPAP